jgi:hypothetical protein
VVVHDIEMHDVSAGIQYSFDVFTEARKVSR